MQEQVREYLAALPPATGAFSYRIPALKIDGRVFHWYATWQAHVSLYPIGDAIREANAKALKGYETSKGTVRFPRREPLPTALVRKLARAKLKELKGLAVLLCSLAGLACSAAGGAPTPEYDVTATFPHDSAAYTQGLVWDDSVLYESTGRYSHSELRRVELRTGRVLARHVLSADRYGEGLALLKGKLYQITWKEQVGYVYDAATLAPLDSFSYAGEGWGLATDGTVLFMTDGSDSIRVLSPETLRQVRAMHVRLNGTKVVKLNELEFVDGALLSNVYETDLVLRIDPASGEVLRVIDFADLYPDRPVGTDVLNGIALSPESGQLLLTGKYWPLMFQVKIKPAPARRP